MSIICVSPLEVDVRCNWFDGRPRAIRFGRDELPVLAVTRVRRESAAYRPAVGPRTCFEVLTRTGRYALVYRHRDRRWLVEGGGAGRVCDLHGRENARGVRPRGVMRRSA
ncbi:MAG: hypothetical protein ACLQBX_03775 [Candidatus Limnocylindrales bacterium]|jgi:hypothetical protein